MIDNAKAYFEEKTGLTIPNKPDRDSGVYEFWAEPSRDEDFVLLTVSLGGSDLSFDFLEGLGNDTRSTRGAGNPYNIWLNGWIFEGRVGTYLRKNGDKVLPGIGGLEINPDSVFANICKLPFRPRDIGKDGRHLAVGEREPT